MIPDDDYVKKAYELCKAHNVLYISDEVQTGFGRTGKLMCYEYAGIKPDIVTLGKAITGGFTPFSGIVARSELMNLFSMGSHGSTFSGNPLSCAISRAAINVLLDENLVENSAKMGEIFVDQLQKLKKKHPMIKAARGKGLFCALEFEEEGNIDGTDFCMELMYHGIITKSTHKYGVRFAPPLVINEGEMKEIGRVMAETMKELEIQSKEKKSV